MLSSGILAKQTIWPYISTRTAQIESNTNLSRQLLGNDASRRLRPDQPLCTRFAGVLGSIPFQPEGGGKPAHASRKSAPPL